MASDLKTIREYFGYKTLGDFGKDWRDLTDEDKSQIRRGFEDGSMTY